MSKKYDKDLGYIVFSVYVRNTHSDLFISTFGLEKRDAVDDFRMRTELNFLGL